MIAQTTFRDAFVFLEAFEKGLNIAGYIPIIGSISAGVRFNYAKIELISGIVFGVLALGVHLQGNASAAGTYMTLGFTFVGHALLNEIRSWIEFIPTLPLVTTLPYDLYATYVVGRRFFSYI